MAALLPLYFDVVSKSFVFSETNPRAFRLPTLYQEDNVTIDFRPLRRIRETGTPFFNRVELSGFDLLITVGSPGTILASASTWTASDGNTLLSGVLDLATSEINNAFGSSTEMSKVLEVRLFDGTNYYRGQTDVTIRKSVALEASLNPVVNDTALGKREASRTYVPISRATGFTLLDEVTGEECLVHLVNGSLLADPITP